MAVAVFIEILEQFVAGQVAAMLDDPREAAVVDAALVTNPAFAAKAELDPVAFDNRMAVAQRGQPKAVVGF